MEVEACVLTPLLVLYLFLLYGVALGFALGFAAVRVFLLCGFAASVQIKWKKLNEDAKINEQNAAKKNFLNLKLQGDDAAIAAAKFNEIRRQISEKKVEIYINWLIKPKEKSTRIV